VGFNSESRKEKIIPKFNKPKHGMSTTPLYSKVVVCILRLKPHEDLKESLQAFAEENNIKAAVIMTCAGSLEQYNLRFANQKDAAIGNEFYEILSLTGTLSATACHLHLCIADAKGKTTGGHLLPGNLIYSTAEIAIASLPDLVFERVEDATYGYRELHVLASHPDAITNEGF
jgi:predicted DNA-binding protein with PD1-like motif